MSASAEHLLSEVLALPTKERAKLVHRVLESLESVPDEEIEAAWIDELVRRAQDVATGRVTPIPWENARADIMAELQKRRAARRTP